MCCTSLFAQSSKDEGPGGTWQIKGADRTGTTWIGELVLKVGKKGALTGHIDWSGSGGEYDGAEGREYVAGVFDATTRTLTLEGQRLENADNLSLGNYSAELSEDGARLVRGKWSDDANPSEWTGKRAAASQAPAGLPAEKKTGFVRKRFTWPDGEVSQYVLFVPHNYNRAKEVPVILFLHGAGETKGGDSGRQPVEVGIGPYVLSHEKTFPYLVVIPRAEEEGWRPKGVNGELALGILDKTLDEYRTDPERVFLTGLSMGGAGTWNFALSEPDRWAAIVPICGFANPEKAEKLKDIPCWVFHNAGDPVIPVSESRQMVAALKKAGSHPKYTEYPLRRHNCWDLAYATPGLWSWLAHQKRK